MTSDGHEMDAYLQTLGNMALIASCSVMFSPMGSMFTIMRYGASGKEIIGLLVPYFLLFTQCFLWSFYGIFTESSEITRVNVLGTVMCGMYLAIMVCHVREKDRRVLQPMVALLAAMLIVVSFGIMASFEPVRRLQIFSHGATFFAILLNVAPMVQIAEVVRTKSTDAFPVALTVAGFISSALWSEYSMLIHDAAYLMPNLLGVFMNGVQLGAVCWVYVKFTLETMDEAEKVPLASLIDTVKESGKEMFQPKNLVKEVQNVWKGKPQKLLKQFHYRHAIPATLVVALTSCCELMLETQPYRCTAAEEIA